MRGYGQNRRANYKSTQSFKQSQPYACQNSRKRGRKGGCNRKSAQSFAFWFLERSFDVVASYPFIRSIGIKCGLEDAIRLERMSEVEYVAAQSKVFALGKGKDESHNEKHCETDNEIVDHSSDNAEVLRRVDKARNTEFAQSNRMFYPIPTFDDNLDGRGVTLCVMDTGVSPHIDLSVPKIV